MISVMETLIVQVPTMMLYSAISATEVFALPPISKIEYEVCASHQHMSGIGSATDIVDPFFIILQGLITEFLYKATTCWNKCWCVHCILIVPRGSLQAVDQDGLKQKLAFLR